jgi:chorismate lyase / 3-hydroxybenzoate synthase
MSGILNVSPRVLTPKRSRASIPTLPTWVRALVAGSRAKRSSGPSGIDVETRAGTQATLVSARLKGAAAMDAAEFEQRTQEGYRAVRDAVGNLHPVRFWNYLPGIHAPMDERRDRYMVFNAGRFAALTEWFDGPDHLPQRLPAASGVGHHGNDLEIHCLAFRQPGEAIENPRQIPAFRYSTRYGPLPPCFARATVVTEPTSRELMLLVAGTASIRGEQSIHQGDLASQLQETADNLRALIAAAEGAPPADSLAAFTEICAYHVHRRDAAAIEEFIRATFGARTALQMVRADICRADLLVEIEGIARLSRRRASPGASARE